jgi:hypothetical protein
MDTLPPEKPLDARPQELKNTVVTERETQAGRMNKDIHSLGSTTANWHETVSKLYPRSHQVIDLSDRTRHQVEIIGLAIADVENTAKCCSRFRAPFSHHITNIYIHNLG